MHISRHYSEHHLKTDSFETRLAIYEDQIRGWFHDQARILQRASANAGFVILLVVISYVENYAIFSKGEDSNKKSKEFFRYGFKDIFTPKLESGIAGDEEQKKIVNEVINEIYRQVRCGLFHTGRTREKVVLSKLDRPVMIEVNKGTGDVLRIHLDPYKMLDRIEDHFSNYVMRLRDPDEKELRENFDKAYEL